MNSQSMEMSSPFPGSLSSGRRTKVCGASEAPSDDGE